MILELNGYAAALWGAACLSMITTCAAWARRKQSPGGTHFAAMMACIVFWGIMAGMEAAAATLAAKILFSKLSYIGICGVLPLFLRFSVAYGGKDVRAPGRGRRRDPHCGTPGAPERRRRSFPWRGLIWVVPAVTLLLVFTNQEHHLVWTLFTPVTTIHGVFVLYGHGPWYWVWVAWCAAVSIVSLVLVVHAAMQGRGIYGRQTAILVTGMVLPWVGEILYVSRMNPFPGLDLPTIGFAVMGVLVLLGMSRFGLFDVIPVARATLFERMSDGVVVLDDRHRLVDMNRAAEALLDGGGRAAADPLTVLLPLLPAGALGPAPFQGDIRWQVRWLDLSVTPLHSTGGVLTGHLIMLRDVTPRHTAQEEREALVASLQSALSDIKTLRGLLPICSSCKKIRDDEGYWQTLELYVQQHSDAHFTHGICEDCIEKLYPEIAHK